MKSMVVKLTMVGFSAALLLVFCPQALPLVHQVFAPPAVQPPEPVLPPPGIKYMEQVEDLIFEMTNQARRAKGVTPLIKDAELRNVARAYSNDMLVRRFFEHTTPDGVDFAERIVKQYGHRVKFVGENIWYASGYTPESLRRMAKEIVDDWMDSPGHRDNLLSPDFTHLGVGVSARHDTIRATQEFVGRPKVFSFGWAGSDQAQ